MKVKVNKKRPSQYYVEAFIAVALGLVFVYLFGWKYGAIAFGAAIVIMFVITFPFIFGARVEVRNRVELMLKYPESRSTVNGGIRALRSLPLEEQVSLLTKLGFPAEKTERALYMLYTDNNPSDQEVENTIFELAPRQRNDA